LINPKIPGGIFPLSLFWESVRTWRDCRDDNWVGIGPVKDGLDRRLSCSSGETGDAGTERVVGEWVKQL